MRNAMRLLIGAAITAALASTAPAQQPAPTKVIGFMTDFDVKDDAVGISKAVTLAGKNNSLPFVRTFSDVPVGKYRFYIDSRGRLGLATNQGDFSAVHKVGEGAALTISKK